MKKSLFVLASFAALFLFSCSNNENSNSESADSTKVETSDVSSNDALPEGTRYGVKSGIVTYEPYEMMGMKMTQTTYFDDYGKKEAQETLTEGEIMGMKTKSHTMIIMAEGYSISYEIENIMNGKDQTKKIARKTKISGPMGGMDFASLSEEMKKRYNYVEEGTENVAGVEGTKYSMTMDKEKANTKITGVIYKNVMLKSEANIGGMKISLKAASFEQDADVPASKFEVPEGYKIEEVDMSKFGQPETK